MAGGDDFPGGAAKSEDIERLKKGFLAGAAEGSAVAGGGKDARRLASAEDFVQPMGKKRKKAGNPGG